MEWRQGAARFVRPEIWLRARARASAANIGQWCAFAFGFIGLFFNPMLTFIAIFIYLAAIPPRRLAQLRGMSRGAPVTAAYYYGYKALSPSARIEEAIEHLAAHEPDRASGWSRMAASSGCWPN